MKKSMKKSVGVCLLSATLSGCASQSFHMNPGAFGDIPDGKVSEPFFFMGLLQGETRDAAKVCGGSSKVARVEHVKSALDMAISILTLTIYTPRTVRVHCVK